MTTNDTLRARLDSLIEQTIAATQRKKEEKKKDPRTEREKELDDIVEKMNAAFSETVRYSRILEVLAEKPAPAQTEKGAAIILSGHSVGKGLAYLLLCLVQEKPATWNIGFYWARILGGNVAIPLERSELNSIPRSLDEKWEKLKTPEGVIAAIVESLYQ